jgi:hypothetical protein
MNRICSAGSLPERVKAVVDQEERNERVLYSALRFGEIFYSELARLENLTDESFEPSSRSFIQEIVRAEKPRPASAAPSSRYIMRF